MAKGSDIIKIGFDYRASLEQFEKETNGVFDGISAKAGKQKISIQLDAKNDKVIEKIKELQKLKLDKFTFEFGESGLAEQLKTFDQLEKKISEIINLSKGKSLIDSSSTINIKEDINDINKLKEIVNKTTITFDDLKTIIRSLPSNKITQFNKMLDRTFSLTSDIGTSLEVMTSEAGKFFTITGTQSKTSFFLNNNGEFTRKPNKNTTPFEVDNTYTKELKYDSNDIADIINGLIKEEQQTFAVKKAQESLIDTSKKLEKTSHIDNSELEKKVDYYREIEDIQRKLDDSYIQNRQLTPVAAYGFDSVKEGEKALKICDEMLEKMKEYYSLAQGEGYGLNALEEMSNNILDVTQNIKPAIESAFNSVKISAEQYLLDNEIGFKIDNSKSEAPKELLDEYLNAISKIHSGTLNGQDAIDLLNIKAKELGVAFDETSKKWINISNTSFSVDAKNSTSQMEKQKDNLDDLIQKYEDLSNKVISDKNVDLVNNEDFQKLSNELEALKQELSDIKVHMELFEQSAMSYDAFIPYENQINSLSSSVEKLSEKYREFISLQKSADSDKSNISSDNLLADSKKNLSNIIDISSKFNQSLDTTDKKYGKIKNDILTASKLFKEMLSLNNDFDKYNEAFSKTYDYVKDIGLEQNVYWNKIWQGVKDGIENDNYDELIDGIYSGSIRENNSIVEFNKEVTKLDNILQSIYGKSINYKEVFLDIFNKLREGAYSYGEALDKIQEDMNNRPSDLFNDMLYNEGLYPTQLKDNKPTLILVKDIEQNDSTDHVVKGQNNIQEELDKTVAKINNVGKAYEAMAYRGVEAEEAIAKASQNYNGATHWSSDEKIARGYGDLVTSGNISLKNAFEVDGNGAAWNKIQVLGDGLEENSKKAIEFATSIDKVYSELSTLVTLDSDFNKFNPGFSLYSTIGEEIDKLLEKQESQDNSESEIVSEKIQRLVKVRDLYSDLVSEYDKFSRDTSHPYGLKTTDELTEYAQANGYDGAIYKNIIDAKHSPIISGNEYIETSNIIVSFYEAQVEYLEKISRKGQEYIHENISNLNIDSTIKDVFQDGSDSSSTAIANEQVSTIEKVETATEQAVQAKQDFVTANENVQSSVDGSKSPLQLEAELMKQIAKDARDAADAKKEFVAANKQVEQSANDSNGATSTSISGSTSDNWTKEINKQLNSTQRLIEKVNTEYGKLSKKPNEDSQNNNYKQLLASYKTSIDALVAEKKRLSESPTVTQDELDKLKLLEDKVKSNSEAFKVLTAAQKGSDSLSRGKEIDTITKYLAQNTKISKEAKVKLEAYIDALKTDGAEANVKKIHEAFLEVTTAERLAGREGQSFLDVLRDKVWYQWAAQIGTYFSFNDIMRYGKEGIEVVRELDTALTEMRKVSEESVQSLKNYQAATFDVADAVGTTAVQIQNSTADWMRLGYSIEEAAELAKNSNIYKNVGDMEIEEATEHMISSVQAWKSEFNDNVIDTSQAIIDRYNKIGNEFAISSADIGEAMETSAAALKAGGNSLNESLGILTAANIIQQDASTTSSALKILSLRIRGAKADLEEMGESTDGLADSSSKMREELLALTGVDIMLDENTFKSTAQIIQEIGENWSKMTDASQAAALELMAGEQNCLKFMETYIYRTHLIALVA